MTPANQFLPGRRQIAEYTGVHPDTVSRWIARGGITRCANVSFIDAGGYENQEQEQAGDLLAKERRLAQHCLGRSPVCSRGRPA